MPWRRLKYGGRNISRRTNTTARMVLLLGADSTSRRTEIWHSLRFRTLLWVCFYLQLLANAADLAICVYAPCDVRKVGTPFVPIDSDDGGNNSADRQCGDRDTCTLLFQASEADAVPGAERATVGAKPSSLLGWNK
eukprot:scaffold492100_cov33-Prasinocladus_malaysianus.AAC.2